MSQSFGDRLARRRETLHDNETPDPFDAAYRTTVNEAIHAAESGKSDEEIRDVLLAIDYVRPRVERFAADYFDLATAQMHESGCRNAVDRLCDVLRDQTVRDQARKAITTSSSQRSSSSRTRTYEARLCSACRPGGCFPASNVTHSIRRRMKMQDDEPSAARDRPGIQLVHDSWESYGGRFRKNACVFFARARTTRQVNALGLYRSPSAHPMIPE
jgi:hypothetical protein